MTMSNKRTSLALSVLALSIPIVASVIISGGNVSFVLFAAVFMPPIVLVALIPLLMPIANSTISKSDITHSDLILQTMYYLSYVAAYAALVFGGVGAAGITLITTGVLFVLAVAQQGYRAFQRGRTDRVSPPKQLLAWARRRAVALLALLLATAVIAGGYL